MNTSKSVKLDVLIPHYDETEAEVTPLLDSLSIQQCVDFNNIGVIIAHDGPEAKELKLKEYPFQVKQIHCPKGGVSATRNAALDASSADYVMFCDADDMFFNACGLYVVFREMNAEKGFDYLVSSFVEETLDYSNKKDHVFVNHAVDFTFVHGKVIRRKFLLDNNIRWNPSLTIHEDSYFNTLCATMSQETKHCQTPFYLWKWRDASVCRHDPKYMIKTYNNMLESSTALVCELGTRGKAEKAAQIVVQIVYDAYFTMNKKEWLDQENQEYRNNTEKRFAQYYNVFRPLYEAVPEQMRAQILVSVKQQKMAEGVLFEEITFNDWMKHISSITV